jgi:hypothetical protein
MMMVMVVAPKYLMLHKIYICHLFHFFIDTIARVGAAPSFGLRTKDCDDQAMKKVGK